MVFEIPHVVLRDPELLNRTKAFYSECSMYVEQIPVVLVETYPQLVQSDSEAKDHHYHAQD